MKRVLIAGVILPAFFLSYSASLCRTVAETHPEEIQKGTTKRIFRYGEPITFHYNIPHAGFKELLKNPNRLWVLVYKNPLNPPEAVEMEKKNGTWKASFTLTDTSVKMIMFAFQAEDSLGLRSKSLIDDNDGDFWDLFIHDATGTPVQGAHQAKALSYAGLGGKREENLDLALVETEKELSLYPDNYSARNFLYSILLRKNEFSNATRKRIEKEIDSILKKHPVDETVLNFAVRGYRMIDETDKARKIENDLIQRNPRSNQAAKKALEEIVKVKEVEVRAQRLEKFLSEFPESRFVEFALSSLASATIELDDSTKMISIGDRLLEKSTTPAGASGLAGIAGVLSEKQTKLDRAVAYAKRALTLIRSATSSIQPPPEISSREWEGRIRTTEARYRDILGWTYVQQGKINQGLSELREAVKETSQPGVYYHLASALQKTGANDEALLNYARAVAFGGEISDMAHEAFYDLWTQSQKNPDEANLFLDEQAEWIKEDYRNRVLANRSIRPAPDFELEDLTGGWVRLSDQRKSIVLLCFWASWSESSRRILKELQDLTETHGKEVLFLTIATDVNRSTVEKFVKKHRIALPVLLNEETDRDYKLHGVPTVFVIDAEGNIHFEHRGYRSDIKEILKIELEDLL